MEGQYVYELMNSETGEAMGLYGSLEKAKETVYDLMSRSQSMQVNRIPLDMVSFFADHKDCIWESIVFSNVTAQDVYVSI